MSSKRAAALVSPPEPVPDSVEKPGPVPRPILPRLVGLLILGVAADLWSLRHLGIGLSSPGWLSTIVASVTGVSAWLDRLVDEEEKKRWAGKVRSGLRPLLATPVMVILALSLGIFALSYSSVMVISADGKVPQGVRLVPLGGGGKPFAIGDPQRLVVYTGPFGQTFRLEVPGFLPKVVSVPVLQGLRVVPESDLQRTPTLLLRPPSSVLKLLAVPGASLRLQVWKEGAGWRPHGSFTCARTPCPAGSYLVGRSQPVPPELLAQWRMELQANSSEEGEIARVLLAWKNPRHLKGVPAVTPEMLVRVEAFSRAHKRVASASFLVGKENFQDVALRKE
jgi:hypothetical protein